MIPKFRAFIKRTEQIEDVTEIDFETEDIEVSSGRWYEIDKVVLMQSTGLKDKNGVEVFVGDLVQHDDEGVTYKACEVVYDKLYGTFCFKWDAGNFISDYDNLIVVGNVHENPELLEVSE